MKKIALLGIFGALALAAGAAVPQFETVPSGANKALKAVKGKPIRSGIVFVNGRYVKPPYVLMRSGTALFINHGTQITDQVVPWKTFIATQGGASAATPAPKAAAPAPAKTVQSVDDLFADTPAPAPSKPSAPAPAAAADSVDENADFTHNEQSRRLLKRINDRRSYLDRKLREGNIMFFGSRYAVVNVSPRLARSLIAILPEAMRDASDGADLHGILRGKGIAYMNREVCEDLIENRQDYLKLIERRKEMAKDDELRRLLEQGAR